MKLSEVQSIELWKEWIDLLSGLDFSYGYVKISLFSPFDLHHTIIRSY